MPHMDPFIPKEDRVQNVLDIERELTMLNEAWAIELNIAIKRRFTHAELEPYIAKVRQAAADLKAVEPTYWDEKRLDRREEFAEEDDINAQRAYPGRRP